MVGVTKVQQVKALAVYLSRLKSERLKPEQLSILFPHHKWWSYRYYVHKYCGIMSINTEGVLNGFIVVFYCRFPPSPRRGSRLEVLRI